MTEPRKPRVYWKYTGPEEQELALFWDNPWLKQEEKIATFWWPGHPIEETSEAERLFEEIAERACLPRAEGERDWKDKYANLCVFTNDLEERVAQLEKENAKLKEKAWKYDYLCRLLAFEVG